MRLGGQRASKNVEDRRGMGMVKGGLGVGGTKSWMEKVKDFFQ